MTHTLSIDPGEWRALLVENLQRLINFANQAQALDAKNLPDIHAHMDRAKVIASSWAAATPQAVPETVEQHVINAGSGVAIKTGEQPKRGGWPKGKPRKRQSAQVVQ